MHALRFLLASLGVVNAAAAVASTTQDTHKSVDGKWSSMSLSGGGFSESEVNPPLEARPLTNARRLALGLPILPPHRRGSKTKHARSDPSALPPTPGVPAPDVPSPNIPVVYTQGVIEVRKEGSDTFLGYVGKDYAFSGAFGIGVDITKAMLFNLLISESSVNLETLNGPDPSNPLLGAVRGPASSDDLVVGDGTAGYCFLVNTNETPVDSVAVYGTSSYPTGSPTPGYIQSAIWHYDAATGAITPRWVNSDLSKVGSLVYISSRIVIISDKESFDANFGQSQAIYLTFLPTV